MSSRLLFQMDIPRRGKQCVQAGEEFYPGADYYSVLIEEDKHGFQRQDFCVACWDKQAKETWSIQADSYWRSTVTTTKPETHSIALRTRDEKALDLLKEASTANTTEDQEDLFLLALYLARRRLLYLRQERQQNGERLNIYEIASTEEMICVKKLNLSQSQVVAAQQRLAIKLRKE